MTKDNHMLGKFNLDGIPPAPRGIPQIEVTFDIDANGILNVTAQDKGTSKTSKITITNEKGRLSKDEIEKMISEAEKYKQDDDKTAAKVQAKNSFENYIFSMKNTLVDEKLKDKFTEEDKTTIENQTKDALQWLDGNPNAEKEEFDRKQKEIEQILNPIMVRIYQTSAPGGASESRAPHPEGQRSGTGNVDDLD